MPAMSAVFDVIFCRTMVIFTRLERYLYAHELLLYCDLGPLTNDSRWL